MKKKDRIKQLEEKVKDLENRIEYLEITRPVKDSRKDIFWPYYPVYPNPTNPFTCEGDGVTITWTDHTTINKPL